ncbi:hypothetical protein DPSP01_010911 [Paraphaeosphaeria sporulosa]
MCMWTARFPAQGLCWYRRNVSATVELFPVALANSRRSIGLGGVARRSILNPREDASTPSIWPRIENAFAFNAAQDCCCVDNSRATRHSTRAEIPPGTYCIRPFCRMSTAV